MTKMFLFRRSSSQTFARSTNLHKNLWQKVMTMDFVRLENTDTQNRFSNADNQNSIITDKDNGRCVIEITEDGYSKGGLHLLIGINSEGTVEGIEFLSIGETPGLGTKVQDDSFLSKLKGFGVDTDENSIDNVTAATYSSKGMKSACKKAVKLFDEHKEEILNG